MVTMLYAYGLKTVSRRNKQGICKMHQCTAKEKESNHNKLEINFVNCFPLREKTQNVKTKIVPPVCLRTFRKV